VSVFSGQLNMSGSAEISSNMSTSTGPGSGGGGVYVTAGTFNMEGGTISDNIVSSSRWGGGVYITNTGTFTMSGGTIKKHTAYNGGGVYLDMNRPFTMTGGIISGNEASNNGGGVYVAAGGIFNKTGNSIIYGSNGGSDRNIASTTTSGPAVYTAAGQWRDATAGTGVNLSTSSPINWGT
jgi:hypothetical protein